jgi:hypothetical protein
MWEVLVSTGLLDDLDVMAKPKTLSVKLHMDVIESARIVAAYKGEQISDMLSNILRPILADMEREAIDQRYRVIHPDKPKPRKPRGEN